MDTANSGMKALKVQHRLTRTCVKGCKLLELEVFQCRLWIRRVLVRAQEGQLKAPHRIYRWRRFPLFAGIRHASVQHCRVKK